MDRAAQVELVKADRAAFAGPITPELLEKMREEITPEAQRAYEEAVEDAIYAFDIARALLAEVERLRRRVDELAGVDAAVWDGRRSGPPR